MQEHGDIHYGWLNVTRGFLSMDGGDSERRIKRNFTAFPSCHETKTTGGPTCARLQADVSATNNITCVIQHHIWPNRFHSFRSQMGCDHIFHSVSSGIMFIASDPDF